MVILGWAIIVFLYAVVVVVIGATVRDGDFMDGVLWALAFTGIWGGFVAFWALLWLGVNLIQGGSS